VPGPEISINPARDSIGSKYSRRERRKGEKLPGHCVELARNSRRRRNAFKIALLLPRKLIHFLGTLNKFQ